MRPLPHGDTALIEAQEKYGPRGVVFMGAAVEDNADSVRDFGKAYGINYTVAMAGKDQGIALLRALGNKIAGLPFTIVLDRQGNIVAAKRGIMTPARSAADTRSSLAPVVRLTHCTFAPYRLPLRQPWVSARGGFVVREGWLVRLVTDAGLIGYGDCAPLPQAGTESMDSAVACLSGWAAALPGLSLEVALGRISASAARSACGLLWSGNGAARLAGAASRASSGALA